MHTRFRARSYRYFDTVANCRRMLSLLCKPFVCDQHENSFKTRTVLYFEGDLSNQIQCGTLNFNSSLFRLKVYDNKHEYRMNL